jgi:hypothetical protein
MEEKIAIIITAYNRPHSLINLLTSLEKIRCERNVLLVISIDNGGTEEVNKIANEFLWNFGEKIVKIHNHKKGLRNHFIWVGDLTEDYENVIFLEDDLIVSPELINFAESAISFYKNKDDIAGICLYNPILCEFTGCKFYQNQDGYDVYFLQHPYWGNIWTRDKWQKFKKWLNTYELNPEIIPKAVVSWAESSFKKIYIQYLAESGKYIVVPRISLVTNTGEAGLHNTEGYYQYQSLLQNESTGYRFCELNQSKAIYDVYMEILPEILKQYNSVLANYDFDVDLKGCRHSYKNKYVLTIRPTKNRIIGYSSLMKPTENAVIYSIEGDGISLSEAEDVVINKKFGIERLNNDIDMNYIVGLKTTIFMLIKIILRKLRGKF